LGGEPAPPREAIPSTPIRTGPRDRYRLSVGIGRPRACPGQGGVVLLDPQAQIMIHLPSDQDRLARMDAPSPLFMQVLILAATAWGASAATFPS